MDSLIFALNATTPIAAMMAIGYFLKRIKLITADFARLANKLVFRVFLPVMLYLNIYNISSINGIELGYVLYSVVAVLIVFALALPATIIFTRDDKKRGALLQSIFRSNYALIGIPLAEALFGQPGVAVASVLSAFSIPLFNILAVLTLSVFGNKRKGGAVVPKVLLGIVKNPLVQAVSLGLFTLLVRELFVGAEIGWRLSDITPLFKLLSYLSNMATPLALIVLGAQFEFSAINALRREIIFGTVARVAIVPLLGLGAALLFFRDYFDGAHFAALVALFATPVAVSSVPMAQEMESDYELAGQLVVWSTLFSSATIFLSSFLLRYLGIF